MVAGSDGWCWWCASPIKAMRLLMLFIRRQRSDATRVIPLPPFPYLSLSLCYRILWRHTRRLKCVAQSTIQKCFFAFFGQTFVQFFKDSYLETPEKGIRPRFRSEGQRPCRPLFIMISV